MVETPPVNELKQVQAEKDEWEFAEHRLCLEDSSKQQQQDHETLAKISAQIPEIQSKLSEFQRQSEKINHKLKKLKQEVAKLKEDEWVDGLDTDAKEFLTIDHKPLPLRQLAEFLLLIWSPVACAVVFSALSNLFSR